MEILPLSDLPWNIDKQWILDKLPHLMVFVYVGSICLNFAPPRREGPAQNVTK
jgi:hypothetical protein